MENNFVIFPPNYFSIKTICHFYPIISVDREHAGGMRSVKRSFKISSNVNVRCSPSAGARVGITVPTALWLTPGTSGHSRNGVGPLLSRVVIFGSASSEQSISGNSCFFFLERICRTSKLTILIIIKFQKSMKNT